MDIIEASTDWHIDPDITFEEWKESGRKLALVDNTLQWHWGEWWNHGHKKWDRAAEEFIKTLPLKRHTLECYGSVSNLVKPSIRIEDLPFRHHQIVASQEPSEQTRWLKKALENHWPVSQLREAIREAQKQDNPPLPEGKFRVLLADPPWCYSDDLIEGYGAASHHYPSMSISELCELSVKDIVADNAVLFLWVTSPMFAEWQPVVPAWGFAYKASFIWDKVKHNYGHYNSVRHELLVLCARGSCLPISKKLKNSVVSVPRSDKHSEKPAIFRQMIEEMYGKADESTHAELFARKKVRGWAYHGNEIT